MVGCSGKSVKCSSHTFPLNSITFSNDLTHIGMDSICFCRLCSATQYLLQHTDAHLSLSLSSPPAGVVLQGQTPQLYRCSQKSAPINSRCSRRLCGVAVFSPVVVTEVTKVSFLSECSRLPLLKYSVLEEVNTVASYAVIVYVGWSTSSSCRLTSQSCVQATCVLCSFP